MKLSRHAPLGVPTLTATACIAVFGLIYLAVPNSAARTKTHLATAESSVGTHLRGMFEKRTAKSCEPTAPIQTEMRFASNPVPGVAAILDFDVMAMEAAPKANIDFDIPNGIAVVSGQRSSFGNLVPGQPYRFSVAVRFDKPGRYEIAAQAIAGESNYRFGRRNKLYAEYNGSQIIVSENPPVVPETNEVIRGKASGPQPKPRHAYPPPAPIDPNGNPVSGAEGSDTTVTGTVRYWHDFDGTDAYAWAYGANVQAWDADSPDADDFLGVGAVASNGSFSVSFDNDADTLDNADVYFVIRTANSSVYVENASNVVYEYTSGVIYNNIADGAHDSGQWTFGSAHALRRAFQVCDDGTTAWAKGYFDLGHITHLTHIRWYTGSTDGSYYQRSDDRIYFEDSDVSSPDVIMHEFGHSYHDSIYGDADWPPGTGGPHSFTGHYTTGLALTEGYGTYYSCIAQGDDWIYESFDPANLITFDCDSNWDGNGAANGNSDGASTGGNTGYDTESAVLSFLLDIDDSRNSATDPYDWMAMDDDEIQDVFVNYLPSGHHCYTITDAFLGYHARNHPYFPKINALMYNHGMDQGINYPPIGLYDGINLYAGTWYYGGYGRGSYDIKNYRSNNYDLNQCYVWLTGPGGEDVGHLGGDGNGAALASGATRNVWVYRDQTGYNPAAPNFVYGLYRVRAGFYDTVNAWHLLDPAEAGTDRDVNVTVVQDNTAPPSCSVVDDGEIQLSTNSIHIVANSSDPESSIQGYWTRVGTTAGAGNVQDWILHDANNVTNFDYTITGLSLSVGTTYYVTVVSQNIHSADSPFAYTDGIKVVSNLLPPVTYTLNPGATIAGAPANILASDDARWEIRPTAVLVASQPPIQLTLNATCPASTLSQLQIRIESNANIINATQELLAYDFVTPGWVSIDTRVVTTSDVTFTKTLTNPNRYIEPGTNAVRMRLTYKANGAVLVYPWRARIDYTTWIITP